MNLDISQPVAVQSLHIIEQELIGKLLEFPATIIDAGRNYSPALVSQYAFELAKIYNSFYAEVSILNEPDSEIQRSRVILSKAVADAIQKSMGLLGIEVPERM
jgi:arginyl-tRNA synthetase